VGQGISTILTFAIGVAISPVPIVAVILVLFSQRARVNGTAFLLGWVLALAVVSTVVYVLAHDGDVATSSAASDSVSWGKIVLGVVLLALARRNWRKRPGPDDKPAMPGWLQSIESVSPPKAFGLAVVLAAVNPKNLILTLGAAAGLAQLGLSTSDAVVSIVVFVAVASVTIVGPVLYALFGGARARTSLDAAKGWLTAHNAAVLAVLFVVFGVDLIAKGLPPLTS
jgi:threonine/homoserine/homoserine lactone efflux protein